MSNLSLCEWSYFFKYWSEWVGFGVPPFQRGRTAWLGLKIGVRFQPKSPKFILGLNKACGVTKTLLNSLIISQLVFDHVQRQSHASITQNLCFMTRIWSITAVHMLVRKRSQTWKKCYFKRWDDTTHNKLQYMRHIVPITNKSYVLLSPAFASYCTYVVLCLLQLLHCRFAASRGNLSGFVVHALCISSSSCLWMEWYDTSKDFSKNVFLCLFWKVF